MRQRRLSSMYLSFLLLCFVSAPYAFPTTWFPSEHVCPLCGTKNTFKEIGSYGSYIFRWPSKYCYVFWPDIDPHVVYSCKQCRLTLFMDDFDYLPAEKVSIVRSAAEKLSFDIPPGGYSEIPMLTRLDAAEAFYKLLDKDDVFWCRFWRVMGYHLAEDKQVDKAKEAWHKSIEYCDRMLTDESRADQRKELLVISGALRFLTDGKDAALSQFRQVKGEKYTYSDKFDEGAAKRWLERVGEEVNEANLKEYRKEFESDQRENMKGRNRFLTELSQEFIDALDRLPAGATWQQGVPVIGDEP